MKKAIVFISIVLAFVPASLKAATLTVGDGKQYSTIQAAVNASVSGYGTDQQLLWFEREGRKFDPDHVLLLFHPNDFLDNHKQSRYGYRKPLFKLDGDGLTLTNVPVERKHPVARLDRWLSQNLSLYLQFEAIQDVGKDAWLSLFEREEERPQEQAVAASGPIDVSAPPIDVSAPPPEVPPSSLRRTVTVALPFASAAGP